MAAENAKEQAGEEAGHGASADVLPGVPDAMPDSEAAEPRTRGEYADATLGPTADAAASGTDFGKGDGLARTATAPDTATPSPGSATASETAPGNGGLAGDVPAEDPGPPGEKAAGAGVELAVLPDGGGRRPDEDAAASYESFDPEAAKRETLDEVAAESGLSDPEQLAAVSDAYDVVYEYSAALMVKTAQDMLPDLRHDVQENQDSKVVFVGRDGRSLALVVRALDPEFFRENCTEVVLSRALAETAVQDLELREGREFPEIADFRGAAGKVDPADTVGAYGQLTDYLRRQGTPVGEQDSHVTLVDTSYKGTVQELLAAIYPDTEFTGRYAFFAASPADPHPRSKFGYAMHLEGASANDGRPVQEMPDDPELAFSNQDALAAIEETLHGPMSSPRRISAAVPEQRAARDDPARLDGFNPRIVSERFTDPTVRDAVMRAAQGAVANRGREVAAGGSEAQAALLHSAGQFRDQVRSWVSGDAADPQLCEYLDAFVRRTDKRAAARLSDVIRTVGMDGPQAGEAWEAFGQCATVADKDAFVDQFSQGIARKE
jgi:hypothetical protein